MPSSRAAIAWPPCDRCCRCPREWVRQVGHWHVGSSGASSRGTQRATWTGAVPTLRGTWGSGVELSGGVSGDDVLVSGRKAIMGALTLYLDFINMFSFLLSFLGNR